MNEEILVKKPLWRRILKKLIIVSVFLIVLIILVMSVWNYTASRALKKEISQIRNAGQPVTFEDLEARLPAVSDQDNAARFYQAGMALMVRKKEITKPLFEKFLLTSENTISTQPSRDVLAQIKSIFDDNQLALEMFDRGNRLPALRTELWIKNGMQFNLDRLHEVRLAAQLLAMRTRYLAITNHPQKAVDSAVSALRLTRLKKQQPLLINCMVDIVCLGLAYNDIEFILRYSRPTDLSLADLQKALQAVDPPTLEEAVLTERVYGIELMRNTLPTENVSFGSALLPERWPKIMGYSPFVRQMAVGYLRDMANILTTAKKPWPDILPAIKNLKPSSLFGKILGLPFGAFTENLAMRLGTGRSTLIAVMIERYRLAHGKLPDSLNDLVPTYTQSLPLDPFTGKNLIYRREKTGYVVYSVGKNLKDDGGSIRQLYDSGIRIRRP